MHMTVHLSHYMHVYMHVYMHAYMHAYTQTEMREDKSVGRSCDDCYNEIFISICIQGLRYLYPFVYKERDIYIHLYTRAEIFIAICIQGTRYSYPFVYKG